MKFPPRRFISRVRNLNPLFDSTMPLQYLNFIMLCHICSLIRKANIENKLLKFNKSTLTTASRHVMCAG